MVVTCDTSGSMAQKAWDLWGSHILLLCILHICSLSHCECNNMCNQLWSNHTYSIVYYLHYFSLFSIISIIIIIILILLWRVVHIQLWYCFDAAKCVFHILTLIFDCVVSFLWGPQTVWFVILHLECSTQNFWGVCVTWWYLGHLESPLFTGYMFDFNVNISYLYLFKPSTIVI